MPTINLAYVAELILKYARKYLYALVIVFFFTTILAMIASFVVAFNAFHTLATNFLSMSAGFGSGDLVSKVYGLLSCMGFTSALNDTKSFLISALLFLFWRILYAQILSAYYLVLRVIEPLVK